MSVELRALLSVGLLTAAALGGFLLVQSAPSAQAERSVAGNAASSPPKGPARALRATSQLSDPQLALARSLYEARCGACHSLDHDRIGPRHRRVFGSKAGSVSTFEYSDALTRLDLTWDEDTLDAWLANPSDIAPGTSMGFRLGDAHERETIIAYLKAASAAED